LTLNFFTKTSSLIRLYLLSGRRAKTKQHGVFTDSTPYTKLITTQTRTNQFILKLNHKNITSIALGEMMNYSVDIKQFSKTNYQQQRNTHTDSFPSDTAMIRFTLSGCNCRRHRKQLCYLN